jgi:hypothetical protein
MGYEAKEFKIAFLVGGIALGALDMEHRMA